MKAVRAAALLMGLVLLACSGPESEHAQAAHTRGGTLSLVQAEDACTLAPDFAGLGSVSNAASATCGTTLAWSAASARCGGTLSYSVYRSASAGFVPSRANRIATGVTGTQFSDTANLASGQRYHYVVRATETGTQAVEEGNTVERSTVPTGVPGPGLGFFDDFDANRPSNPAGYWSTSTQVGTANTLNLVSGCRYQSATRAYRFGATQTACGGAYPNSVQAMLTLGGNGSVPGINGFTLPSLSTSPQLSFRLWYQLEGRWDGVHLLYSTGSATGPWLRVDDAVTADAPYIAEGGYDNTLFDGAGTRGWTGIHTPTNGDLKSVTVNLDALAGQTVWFAFRFLTDSSVTNEGVYVDDVRLSAPSASACTTARPPPGPAASYRFTGVPASTPGLEQVDFALEALDATGQRASGYFGSAALTSTDAFATLPSQAFFSAGLAGGLSVRFGTAGLQRVVATDLSDASVTGSVETSVTANLVPRLAFDPVAQDVIAGEPITPAVRVRLLDRFGNATAESGVRVSLALSGGPQGEPLVGTVSALSVNGVATFADLSIGGVSSSYVLSANAEGYLGASSNPFAVHPSAPTHLVFHSPPTDGSVGERLSPLLVIEQQDRFGNRTYTSPTITVALAAGPAGAVMYGTTTLTAVDGLAVFEDLVFDRMGSGYQLSVSTPGFSPITSQPFSIGPGPARHALFTRQPSDVLAGSPITPAVEVSLYDAFMNPATTSVTPVQLTLGSNPGQGTLGGTLTVVPVAGVARFDNLSVDRAAAGYTLLASANGVGSIVSTGFDVRAGAAARLVFLTPPTRTLVDVPFTPALRVAIVDAAGNVVPGASQSVSLTLSQNPWGAALRGVVSVAAVNGVATFPSVSVDRAGSSLVLTATAAGLAAATSPAFDIAASVPPRLVFRATPTSASAMSALPTVQVELRDASGQLLGSSNVQVTLALATNPAAGTLSGQTTVTTSQGVATFTGLLLRKAGTGYSLQASASGFTSAQSGTFDVTAGPADRFVVTMPANVAAGTAVTVSAAAYDAHGNAALSHSGGVRLNSSDLKAQLPQGRAFANGLASLDVVFLTPGLQTLTFTDLTRPTLSGQTQTTVGASAKSTVVVTSPESGIASSNLTLRAEARLAPGIGVSKLSLLRNGKVVASGNQPTLSTTWDAYFEEKGTQHTIKAQLVDSAGNVVESEPVTIEVGGSSGCSATGGGTSALGGLLLLAHALGRRRRSGRA